MAKDKESGLALYGAGTAAQQRNPFNPTEKAYESGSKGITTNRGSNFSMKVHDTNIMDESLAKRGGPRGSTTDSLSGNEKGGK